MQNAKEHAQREIVTVFRSTGEPTAILNNLRRCSPVRAARNARDDPVRRRGRLQRLPAARVQAVADRLDGARAGARELIDQYRGKHDYDCIVPFSGGKDSTFTLYELVHALQGQAARRDLRSRLPAPDDAREHRADDQAARRRLPEVPPELEGRAEADAGIAAAQGRLLLALPHRHLFLPDADRGEVQGAAGHLGRAELRVHQLLRLRRRRGSRRAPLQPVRQSRASPPKTCSACSTAT